MTPGPLIPLLVLSTLLAGAPALAEVTLAGAPAPVDETLDVGAAVPSASTVREGLFPKDEEDCEQARAAGFVCLGFSPPKRFSLPATSFRLGSAELPPGLRKQLDVFAEVLRERDATSHKVRVEGHTDASGKPGTNLALSQKRAEAARDYLVAKGVKPDLLVAVGVGANDPKDADHPRAADNRRVVIAREKPAEPAGAGQPAEK